MKSFVKKKDQCVDISKACRCEEKYNQFVCMNHVLLKGWMAWVNEVGSSNAHIANEVINEKIFDCCK